MMNTTTNHDLSNALNSLGMVKNEFKRIVDDPAHHNKEITWYLKGMLNMLEKHESEAEQCVYRFGGL